MPAKEDMNTKCHLSGCLHKKHQATGFTYVGFLHTMHISLYIQPMFHVITTFYKIYHNSFPYGAHIHQYYKPN